MTEKQFYSQIRDLAIITGWMIYHTWTSIHSAAGYPDITLVRGDRLVFAELKTDKGRVTPQQQAWIDALRKTKAEVYLWRPSYFDDIVEILR
jgi:hypothetical protein